MKKYAVLILLLFLALTLSSCSYSETELKNRLIIEGIGVDYNSESKEYELSVQTLMTSKSGGKESTPDNPVMNYTVKGKTVAEALNSLCETTGKNPLYSQNRVIILGSSVKGKQFIKVLDYFVREYTARADVYVAAASGSAADILKTSDGSGDILAKTIEKSIDESYADSIAVNTELYNVVNLYLEECSTFTLPLLEVVDDRNADSKAVKVTGTYVYTGNDNVNRLSDKETMFFRMVMGDAEHRTFSIKVNDSFAGLDIIKCRAGIKIRTQNGKPYCDININCVVDIVEYEADDFGDLSMDDMTEITSALEGYIISGVTEMMNRQLKEEKCDIFRLGRRIMQNEHELYDKLSGDWENFLTQVDFDVTAKASVRRIGQESMRR